MVQETLDLLGRGLLEGLVVEGRLGDAVEGRESRVDFLPDPLQELLRGADAA